MKLIWVIFLSFLIILSCGDANLQEDNKPQIKDSIYNKPVKPSIIYSESDSIWIIFREKLLTQNLDSLSMLIKFPLKVKGTLDSYPIHYVNPKGLSDFISKFLKESIINSRGKTITNYEDLKTMENPKYLFNESESFRVNQFLFIKENNQWKLEQVYSDVMSGK